MTGVMYRWSQIPIDESGIFVLVAASVDVNLHSVLCVKDEVTHAMWTAKLTNPLSFLLPALCLLSGLVA